MKHGGGARWRAWRYILWSVLALCVRVCEGSRHYGYRGTTATVNVEGFSGGSQREKEGGEINDSLVGFCVEV